MKYHESNKQIESYESNVPQMLGPLCKDLRRDMKFSPWEGVAPKGLIKPVLGKAIPFC